ncbi:restriction endonuclease subunit S [Salmonella enterica subsp. salamae]|nr:restriction endonuclease subunit S [Salmonella enterica subsp. salamae]
MRYAQYSELDSTEVPWLQKKPSHWRIKKLKYSAALIKNKISAEDSPLPYLGLEHIESWTGRKIDGEISNSEGLASSFLAGDVLFGKLRPYLAKVHLALQPGLISSEALVVRHKDELCASFLKYYMLSRDFINIVDSSTYGSKMPRASWDFIGNLPILLPEVKEQQEIASFLEFKTSQINVLISKQKALLAKLAENRTALIHHAVTQGLDPSVPVRDSGIAWLGKIPKHWETKRLRFYMTTNPSKSEIKLAGEELVSFIPMESVGEYGGLSLSMEKELDEVGSGYTYFAENDVVVAKITPCFENGKGAIARGLKNGVAFGTTELHVLRAGEMILPDYLFHLTMSHSFRSFGESEMYGAGGQKRVPETFLKDFRIGLPPLSEQKDLVDYINKVNQQIALQMRKTADMISRLTEYRSTLITNAVTGKIDVRNFSIPENCESQRTECA